MIARGSGFVRGNKQAARARLVSHLKYTEHRSRDPEQESRDDRRIFSKEQDVVDRREAVNDIMEHTSSRVSYHKIILSPGQDEPIADWRQWTRDVMQDLQERQGKELHWNAVQHHNTDNPHIHVVLAGAGENLETGKVEQVKMYTQDYQFMRESGREHSEHDWYRHLQELVKEEDQQEIPSQERGPRSDDTYHHDHGDFDR